MLKLHFKKPDAPRRMRERLPFVAKRMEQYLYLKAGSYEEYSNMATLPARMENFRKLVLERCRSPAACLSK